MESQGAFLKDAENSCFFLHLVVNGNGDLSKTSKRKKDKPAIFLTRSMSLFFCRMIFIEEELERFVSSN